MITTRYLLLIPIFILFSSLIGCAGYSNAVHTHEGNAYYELHVPASKVILIIPKNGLIHYKVKIGGETDSPRYFFFADARKNLAISGWFDSAQRYQGLTKYWDDRVKSWSRMGLQVQDVSFEKFGNWDSVFYNDKMFQSNLNANWIQAKTWIQIHISITSNSPHAEVRSKLVDVLNSIQVLERN